MKTKYQISRQLSGCIIGACPAVYESQADEPNQNSIAIGRNLNPNLSCFPLPGCPAIYEGYNNKPEDTCIAGIGCPAIVDRPNGYVVVGTLLTPEQVKECGLEEKIARDEAAVFVPKDIIDKMAR